MTEFDKLAKNYSAEMGKSLQFSGKGHSFFLKAKAKKISNLIFSLGNSKLKILDVGCGTGALHPFLENSKLSIHGVDVSEQSLEIARKNCPDSEFSHYDGGTLPYGDDQFDAAFCVCVLHHVDPLMRNHFMAEMYRVVKPSGLVIIAEHNPWNPLTQYVVKNSPLDENAKLLSCQESHKLLSSQGLSDVRSDFILLTPFEWKWTAWLENLFRKIPLSAQYIAWGKKR